MNLSETSVRLVPGAEVDYTSEARDIQNSAATGWARVVKLGPIIFFSAPNRDAWMLDPEQGLAVCLAHEGAPRPIPIQETSVKLQIAWDAEYRIEGELFMVTRRGHSAASVFVGYPTAEIERMARQYPAAPLPDFSAVEAVRARLKVSRNDPCPCGSGTKYKKCCLAKDQAFVHQAVLTLQAEVQRCESEILSPGRDDTTAQPAETDLEAETEFDPEEEDETALAPDVQARFDDLWERFDALKTPTAQQMDALLTDLLALPPEGTDWYDVLHAFARHGHPDLSGVFRRIAALVPHTKANGMAFFYWAAAEEFIPRRMNHLLPEVAAGFQKLDLKNYDPDALLHLENWLLVAGCEMEALPLAEYFLPIERADEDLMSYAVPHRCSRIFDLRVGRAIRTGTASETSLDQIAAQLRQNIEEEIHPDAARLAAEIVSGQAPAALWSRAQFDLVTGDICTDDTAWRDCLRLQGTLLRIAQEAWQLEAQPPGCALHSFGLLLHSLDRWRGTSKSKKAGANLLNYLHPEGLEERVARSCPSLLGVDEPRALLLVQALALLTRSASRHALISAKEAAAMEKELSRLQKKLEPQP
jgi:hypothetical protein